MNTATIKVRYVNLPREGKKMGSVKTYDDDYYSVWPSDLGKFEPDQTYTVQYEESDYQGKTFKTIKFPKGPSRAKPSQTQTHTNGSTKSVEMFVMGTIGRSLQGTGTFPDGATLEGWIRDARMAWENGFREPAGNAELDDPIPF